MRNQNGNIYSGILIILLLSVVAGGIFFLITKSNNSNTKQSEQINYVDDSNDENTVNDKNTDTKYNTDEFDYDNIDGLKNPIETKNFELEVFEPGISSIEIFEYDINNDGLLDKITKSYYLTWTAHSYYEYKIELNKNNKYIDITPKNFRTEEAADCPLQKLRFIFKPSFSVIVVSRPGGETFVTPTKAKKVIYKLSNNKIVQFGKEQDMGIVCDVTDLLK
ncbi:MAG: hypothetical protein ACLRFI_01705 [Alphaproteobacteria bacterium]